MELLKDKRVVSVTGDGVDDIDAVLEDNLLALFFSASWCLATRQFLPLFKQFCAEVKKRSGCFRVLCVPFDKTERDMWTFYEDTPKDWMTLALDEQQTITELREMYRVNVVPKLVVVNTDNGNLISSLARKEIQDKGIAAYRLWYDVFRPSLLKRRMKAAVRVVMVMHGMQNATDGEKRPNDKPREANDSQPARVETKENTSNFR